MSEQEQPPAEVIEAQKTSPLHLWIKRVWILDLILMVLLSLGAVPIRLANTAGDLWFDEADYAHAGVKGFEANRWDTSSNPKQPLALIIQRHYHPPMNSYLLGIARRWGADEKTLRTPFVVAGALVVGFTYLCGVILFRGRRELAVGAALLVLITPMQVRAGSHAIPWALITLNLMLLLWLCLKCAETRRPQWLIAIGLVLGTLFSVSEIFLPTLLVMVCIAPFLLFPEIRNPANRKQILLYTGVGSGLLLLTALILWPAGLQGSTLTMLRHYMEVSTQTVEHASLGGRVYDRAPKWAYLFWYWRDYRPYLILYLAGFAVVPILLAFKRLSREAGLTLVYTLLYLAVAHKAHIIGPQYLAHCLPLLSLVAGLALYGISLLWRPLPFALMTGIGFWIIGSQKTKFIEDELAMTPRTAQAALYLKGVWRQGDKLFITTQQPTVLRWYLQQVAGVPVADEEILATPSARKIPEMLANLNQGKIRFVAVANTFDPPSIAEPVTNALKGWKKVYNSEELGRQTSRFTLYEFVRLEAKKR
ncbi:MAG: glycosyltransferase family 39 protein [Armatimonadetes bacterium]|nr:glycosyltransferase family 39 protein [Armatimonadota bacterium]